MVQVTREDAPQILENYLKEHGISQTFVARKMGMKLSTFNMYVKGRSHLDADFAIQVAKVLGISPDVFFNENYRKSV